MTLMEIVKLRDNVPVTTELSSQIGKWFHL